jgi:biotin carboxylase
MRRILLLATTTGYQTRAFGEAAERIGAELVFATDRCHLLDDPWQDSAIPIRFYEEDAAVAAIVEAASTRPIDGVLVVGDRPTVIGARVAEALGLPGHPPGAAAVARHKLKTRECLRNAGLPVPWFEPLAIEDDSAPVQPLSFPCIVKPVTLSGSRGVIRANDPGELASALDRLRALLRSPEIRAERDASLEAALIEEFIPGVEYAVEGLMHRGQFQLLALFDKPDPLDGPFFEETIYLTPSSASSPIQSAIAIAVADAATAIGLCQGPVHAECRVNVSPESGAPHVFVLEVAARPIGGLCARALRFQSALPELPSEISLEELLLRHALGEDPSRYRREPSASGVMMIPIPRRGIYRGVDGVDVARRQRYIDDVRITAKADQLLVPLPEGASYLGFIFARAGTVGDVERALRAAHASLTFAVAPEFPLIAPGQMHYNRGHG